MTTEEQRIGELEHGIRKRLRKVCASMTEADFSDLVRKIAVNTRRGEMRTGKLGLAVDVVVPDPAPGGDK